MKEEKATIGLLIVFFVIAFLIAVVQAHMEAKTYNKVTGNNVTWWDAMWIDLRVQDSPK